MSNVIEMQGFVSDRPYPLRFEQSVSPIIVKTAIEAYNAVLEQRVGGACYFPEETTLEVINGRTVHAVYLRADDAAWTRFCARGESLTPYVSGAVNGVKAKPTTVAPMPMPERPAVAHA